jgi:hypothetical protein
MDINDFHWRIGVFLFFMSIFLLFRDPGYNAYNALSLFSNLVISIYFGGKHYILRFFLLLFIMYYSSWQRVEEKERTGAENKSWDETEIPNSFCSREKRRKENKTKNI